MKELFRKNWFRTWVLLIILSPLLSFIGSYGYFYVLALFFPLAQFIGINRIQKSKWNLIWLLHFPFWVFVLSLDLSPSEIIISILLNSLLGEILLSILFQKFARFIWFISNSMAFGILYSGLIMSGSNDFAQIVMMIISYGISACIMGLGLEYGYVQKHANVKR
jgi:hypothetical protein